MPGVGQELLKKWVSAEMPLTAQSPRPEGTVISGVKPAGGGPRAEEKIDGKPESGGGLGPLTTAVLRIAVALAMTLPAQTVLGIFGGTARLRRKWSGCVRIGEGAVQDLEDAADVDGDGTRPRLDVTILEPEGSHAKGVGEGWLGEHGGARGEELPRAHRDHPVRGGEEVVPALHLPATRSLALMEECNPDAQQHIIVAALTMSQTELFSKRVLRMYWIPTRL